MVQRGSRSGPSEKGAEPPLEALVEVAERLALPARRPAFSGGYSARRERGAEPSLELMVPKVARGRAPRMGARPPSCLWQAVTPCPHVGIPLSGGLPRPPHPFAALRLRGMPSKMKRGRHSPPSEMPSMVPKEGLEPSRPFGYGILSPARLTVPPLRPGEILGTAPNSVKARRRERVPW